MHSEHAQCTFFKLQSQLFWHETLHGNGYPVRCISVQYICILRAQSNALPFCFSRTTGSDNLCTSIHVLVCALHVVFYFNCFHSKSLIVHFYFCQARFLVCWCVCNQQTTSFSRVWTVENFRPVLRWFPVVTCSLTAPTIMPCSTSPSQIWQISYKRK